MQSTLNQPINASRQAGLIGYLKRNGHEALITGGPSSCYEINVTGSDQYLAYCVTFEFI